MMKKPNTIRTVRLNKKPIVEYINKKSLSNEKFCERVGISDRTLRRIKRGQRVYRSTANAISDKTGIHLTQLYRYRGEIRSTRSDLIDLLNQAQDADNTMNYGLAVDLAIEAFKRAKEFPKIAHDAKHKWAIYMDHSGQIMMALEELDRYIDRIPKRYKDERFWIDYQRACIRISMYSSACPTLCIAPSFEAKMLLNEAELILKALLKSTPCDDIRVSVLHHMAVIKLFRGDPTTHDIFRDLFDQRTPGSFRRVYDKRREAHALSVIGRDKDAVEALKTALTFAKNTRLRAMLNKDLLWMGESSRQ